MENQAGEISFTPEQETGVRSQGSVEDIFGDIDPRGNGYFFPSADPVPGTGDPARHWGPFPGDRPHPEKSGLFHFLNTNKRSVLLDPDRDGDRDRLLSLLAGADVFVQGYRPGAMDGWGFSPEACAALRPGIVTVSLSAYGHAGPWSDRPGFDSLVQTACGLNPAEAPAARPGVGPDPIGDQVDLVTLPVRVGCARPVDHLLHTIVGGRGPGRLRFSRHARRVHA